MGNAGEIERSITAFGKSSNGGLIVSRERAGGGQSRADRCAVRLGISCRPSITLAYVVTGGGLISYGPNYVDEFRQAAGYVDRILKGEKPADMPVQAPTKLRIGHQSQDRQGAGHLTFPPSRLLATADEVIE